MPSNHLLPGEVIELDYLFEDKAYKDVEVYLAKGDDHPNFFVFKDVVNGNKKSFSLLNEVGKCDTTDVKSKTVTEIIEEVEVSNSIVNREIPENRKLSLISFAAYPNPTSGQININFQGNTEPTVVQVTDITGKEVFKDIMDDFNGSYNKDLDLSNYAKGQYILYVIQNQKIFTESIIFQ